jgi:hypothetical protein
MVIVCVANTIAFPALSNIRSNRGAMHLSPIPSPFVLSNDNSIHPVPESSNIEISYEWFSANVISGDIFTTPFASDVAGYNVVRFCEMSRIITITGALFEPMTPIVNSFTHVGIGNVGLQFVHDMFNRFLQM